MTIIELSNGQQVDVPDNISIFPDPSGDNTIFISDEAAKLLPAGATFISVSAGGKKGSIFLGHDKHECENVLIPQDVGQNIIFPALLDDD
ncbi:MAG: hypothetical protein V1810_01395 [Candidatus Beckwithbacteria bacterium]